MRIPEVLVSQRCRVSCTFPQLGARVVQSKESVRQVRTVAMASSTRTALVPVANGSEEMEAVIMVDCLRRAGVRHARSTMVLQCTS